MRPTDEGKVEAAKPGPLIRQDAQPNLNVSLGGKKRGKKTGKKSGKKSGKKTRKKRVTRRR